jgi:hypothetical protein
MSPPSLDQRGSWRRGLGMSTKIDRQRDAGETKTGI